MKTADFYVGQRVVIDRRFEPDRKDPWAGLGTITRIDSRYIDVRTDHARPRTGGFGPEHLRPLLEGIEE